MSEALEAAVRHLQSELHEEMMANKSLRGDVARLESELREARAALEGMKGERDAEREIAQGWERKHEDAESALSAERTARVEAERERDEARAALRMSRINLIVAACDGQCLCGNDAWLSEHNARIDAALAAEPGDAGVSGVGKQVAMAEGMIEEAGRALARLEQKTGVDVYGRGLAHRHDCICVACERLRALLEGK